MADWQEVVTDRTLVFGSVEYEAAYIDEPAFA
jgi:hypothetical protein